MVAGAEWRKVGAEGLISFLLLYLYHLPIVRYTDIPYILYTYYIHTTYILHTLHT
jgi:hypothetical protein